ncbi:MAG: transposase, partial [Bacteroidota bacterium]
QQRTACYRRSESILAKFNLPDNIPASYQVQSAAIDQVVQSLTTQILALEKSLHHRSSKDGNKYLKIAFCDAAVHAIQYYPEVKAFYNKMVRRGNTAIARTIAAKELAKNRLSHTQEQRTLSGFQRSADLTAEVFAVAATAKPGCLTDIS